MNDLATVSPPAARRAKSVLTVAGSLRRASINRRLLEAASELAPPALDLSPLGELATLPLYDGDLEAATEGGPAAAHALRRRVAAADGLLFATPEYNGSLPGVLKNAIDWLSRNDPATGRVLAGKPVAIVGATPGVSGTRDAQRHLREVLGSTRSLVLPTPALHLADAAGRFDSAGRLTDAASRERLAALLAAFAEWIGRFAPEV